MKYRTLLLFFGIMIFATIGLVAQESLYEKKAKEITYKYLALLNYDKEVERFCSALQIITFAVSLGHDESLIFPQPSYDERIDLYPEKFRKGFIRFSVGLEDVEDIIADLDQALKTIGL